MKVRSQGHRRCSQMVAGAISLTKEQLLFLGQQTLRRLVTDLQFPLGNSLSPHSQPTCAWHRGPGSISRGGLH